MKWTVLGLALLFVSGLASPPTVPKGCQKILTCDGYSQTCSLAVDSRGCPECRCPSACPHIYCGVRCRRVIRRGRCPYCDCRKGKQVFILGKKT